MLREKKKSKEPNTLCPWSPVSKHGSLLSRTVLWALKSYEILEALAREPQGLKDTN